MIEDAEFPLFRRCPELAAAVPRLPLGNWPTPVVRVARPGLPAFAIKRDDECHPDYAGNKLRKLEFLLGRARAQGRKRLFAVGYAGSNFTLATALHGAAAGLRTTALLLPQAPEDYVRRNLLWSSLVGADIRLCANEPSLALAAARLGLAARWREGRWPLWVPAGGSAPVGVLGFVNAALELVAQCDGALPRRVYVAVGSMGSALGLKLGFALCAAPVTVVAVPVTPPRYASEAAMRRLERRVRKLLPPLPDSEGALEWRSEFRGPDYGVPSAESAAAAAWLAEAGFPLDQTYAAKAFACLKADAGSPRLGDDEALLWLTSNGRSAPALPEVSALPARVRRYLESARLPDAAN